MGVSDPEPSDDSLFHFKRSVEAPRVTIVFFIRDTFTNPGRKHIL